MEACAGIRYDIPAAHCDGDPTKEKIDLTVRTKRLI
jgi:hypothetical protein